MKTISRLTMAVAILGIVLTANAQERDPDAAALKYRQSVMTVILGNLGPIAGMVKGHTGFDGRQMAMRADRIQVMSTMIEEAFMRDTRAADLETEALDAIWENYDDFVSKIQKLSETSAALAEAARQGEDEAKAAFKTMAGACKGCHDDFKVDKD